MVKNQCCLCQKSYNKKYIYMYLDKNTCMLEFTLVRSFDTLTILIETSLRVFRLNCIEL